MLAIGLPAEQDVAGVWFSGQPLPRERVRPGGVFLNVLLDGLNSPVGERDNPLAVVLGQGEYV